MERKLEELLKNWKKRNIEGFYFEKKDLAHEKILQLVPQKASVGFCGSQTLEQLEIIEMLESRGNPVFNQYDPKLSRQESLESRQEGTRADFYLGSANAIAQSGELVFFSAYGHRISGIANARNVIIIAGINKITSGLETAIIRAREYAAPLNCQRLNWDAPCSQDGTCHSDMCFYPDYMRMCCQILIIEAEVNPERLKVILVGEELGF
jgi:hypothetical protein